MLENSMEKGDIVILTNRYESQLCAIEKEAPSPSGYGPHELATRRE